MEIKADVIPITSTAPANDSRLIIGFQTPDRLLYHYTKLSTAKEKILPSRTLQFSSITKTKNDPKERKHWKFSLGTNTSRDLLNVNSAELSKRLSGALKANTKVGCFCQDQQPLTGDQLRDIFRRGWSKPRMWAQYAENHTGVCLVFDRQRLDQAICKTFGFYTKIYRGSVAYINRSVAHDWSGDFTANMDEIARVGFDRYAEAHFDAFVKPLFFEKMLDWRDEDEFRWIVADKDDSDKLVDISSALVGIIYGDETGAEAIRTIIDLTRDLPLMHIALQWSNSSPWYDYLNPLYSAVSKWGKPDASA